MKDDSEIRRALESAGFDGKRVGLDIVPLKQRGLLQQSSAKPRLRFDKVARGLLERLRVAAGKIVPEGTTVLLTVTAPIRLDSKTGAALEARIQALARRKTPGRDREETIHGNHVRMRLLRTGSARAPKLIGFVHNPETGATCFEAYRSAFAQLDVSPAFGKVAIVFGDSRAEALGRISEAGFSSRGAQER